MTACMPTHVRSARSSSHTMHGSCSTRTGTTTNTVSVVCAVTARWRTSPSPARRRRCCATTATTMSSRPSVWPATRPSCQAQRSWSMGALRGMRTALCAMAVRSPSVASPSSPTKTTTTVYPATRAGSPRDAATAKRRWRQEASATKMRRGTRSVWCATAVRAHWRASPSPPRETRPTASSASAASTHRSVPPVIHPSQGLARGSTFLSRIGSGTSPASSAPTALSLWLGPASSLTGTRSFAETATTTKKTNENHFLCPSTVLDQSQMYSYSQTLFVTHSGDMTTMTTYRTFKRASKPQPIFNTTSP